MMKNDLFPKFVITSAMLSLVAAICERLGQLHGAFRRDLRLRRINRIRTIQASLQIEGNVLTVEQVTAVLDGKKVLAPARDVQEIRNALAAYDKLDSWNTASIADLLDAHKTLMTIPESSVPAVSEFKADRKSCILHRRLIWFPGW